MEKRDFELYEFGGLNDSKKITATFAHYEVYNGHEGLTISALLKASLIVSVRSISF